MLFKCYLFCKGRYMSSSEISARRFSVTIPNIAWADETPNACDCRRTTLGECLLSNPVYCHQRWGSVCKHVPWQAWRTSLQPPVLQISLPVLEVGTAQCARICLQSRFRTSPQIRTVPSHFKIGTTKGSPFRVCHWLDYVCTQVSIKLIVFFIRYGALLAL